MGRGRRVTAAAVAAVWLHQGLWCKVLGREPRHERIVAEIPLVGSAHARTATVAIGAAEVVLAAWLLSGRRPVVAAGAQTGLLAAMNVGGLLVARERIPAPTRMVVRNLALVAAIWTAAGPPRRRR